MGLLRLSEDCVKNRLRLGKDCVKDRLRLRYVKNELKVKIELKVREDCVKAEDCKGSVNFEDCEGAEIVKAGSLAWACG